MCPTSFMPCSSIFTYAKECCVLPYLLFLSRVMHSLMFYSSKLALVAGLIELNPVLLLNGSSWNRNQKASLHVWLKTSVIISKRVNVTKRKQKELRDHGQGECECVLTTLNLLHVGFYGLPMQLFLFLFRSL